MVKRGRGEGIFSKFREELAKRGELKNPGGFGPWMKLCLIELFEVRYLKKESR